jgi:hypothetical protein
MKDRLISARVDAELEERLKAAADKDRRNLSDYVRLVLIDAVSQPKPEPEVTA